MIETLFGSGDDLGALQMAMRALVLFFIMLVMVRAAGMRAFGRKSPFDTILVITLGAVLSRAISGASAFWPTVAAGSVLAGLHRGIAIATSRWHGLEELIKGKPTTLYDNGRLDERAMTLAGISRRDLDEAVRKQTDAPSFAAVARITMETSGDLTVTDQKMQRDDGGGLQRVGAPHRAAPAPYRR